MNVNDYKIFKDNQCSLQETSKDTSSGKNEFMTFCTKKVVNFDDVKKDFLNKLGESYIKAHSVDALVLEDKNYLIEFKNGDIRNEKNTVMHKAKDSIMILNSITNRQINESRQDDIFIVVYNQKKVVITNKASRAKKLAEKSNDEYDLFGFGKLKGFCFHDVLVYNEDEFQKEIVENLGWGN